MSCFFLNQGPGETKHSTLWGVTRLGRKTEVLGCAVGWHPVGVRRSGVLDRRIGRRELSDRSTREDHLSPGEGGQRAKPRERMRANDYSRA